MPESAPRLPDLPKHLAERTRTLSHTGVNPSGAFVLYWMHHAVRGHENPALDAALSVANALQLPVLVYPGLSGQHRFNNDRHDTFNLQGARDAHAELQARGVRAVFHLDTSGEEPSPLKTLIMRAALVVFEDFPAPPFPAWSANLAKNSPVQVIAVDSACVVPMQTQPRRFGRAYEFRRNRYRDRVLRPASGRPQHIAVIGAGISGLTAARVLRDQGHQRCAATKVAPPQRRGDRWKLTSEQGTALGNFERLIVAAPAPQAQTLLRSAARELAAQAAVVSHQPTWAVMLAFSESDRLAYHGLFFDQGPLSWAAENSSKPGRNGHTWVLHASAEWTHAHLDATANDVAEPLADWFCTMTGLARSAIAHLEAHRWLYSLVTNPLNVGALWNSELGSGACGNWCQGARIEGAFLSGQAIAGRILGDLAAPLGRQDRSLHRHAANWA